MKTSIFNMTFTLPPLIGMTEVVKDMPTGTHHRVAGCRPPPTFLSGYDGEEFTLRDVERKCEVYRYSEVAPEI